MKIFPSLKQVVWVTLFLTLLSSSSVFASNLLITRSFSGFWDQPDQESQGIILQIGGDEREFEVEIENVPAGLYSLVVDDVPVHDIEVVEEDGKTKGKLKFSNPQKVETLLLDFDPLGEIVEVFQDSALILDALFPDECPSRIQGNSDDKRAGSDAGPFLCPGMDCMSRECTTARMQEVEPCREQLPMDARSDSIRLARQTDDQLFATII